MDGQNGQTRPHVSQTIGIANEGRVVRVLNDPGWFRRPAWFMSARLATKEEDRRGIDVVIQTSINGPIHIQVKSSAHRGQVWKRKHPNTNIILIVVSCKEEDLVLRQQIMEKIQKSLYCNAEEHVDARRVSNGSRRRR